MIVVNSQRSRISKRVFYFALSALLFTLSSPVWAQQPRKTPRIGVVGLVPRSLEAFREVLRNLGYVDGKTVQIVYRDVEGNTDRMPELVAELVQLKVDVLVVNNTTLVRAAQRATKTIPIVMRINEDPVAIGLVNSLANPGGNLTGIASLIRDLSGKRLELFKETVPPISRIGVFWVGPGPLGQGRAFQNYEPAARALNLELKSLQMHRPNPDLDGQFRVATEARVNALITVTNAVLNPHIKKTVNFGIKNRLPLMVEGSNFVEEGGLISYAANDLDSYGRMAAYVDKILKGAKPADLPIEQPKKFELVINLKTAKQIGVTIPPNVLARADRVIR